MAVRIFFILAFGVFSISSFSSVDVGSPGGFEMNNSEKAIQERKDNDLRVGELAKASYSYHFQVSAIEEYENISNKLRSIKGKLDQIYSFSSYLLNNGRVLPPVITESDGSFEILSNSMSRITSKQYKIEKQARIVATPPTWRDYLYQDFDKPIEIHSALMPKNEMEWRIFNIEKERAIESGKKHAFLLFDHSKAVLDRDMKGIVKFHALSEMGMVDVPILSEGRVGIKVGDTMLDIDQRVFELHNRGGFKGKEEWKPIISTN
ncbi:MAG: type IV secretory system conjugative DNA transfer family protein [Methyloprofundus sp.]|nr:type IV secretory system conjugative DNA transfer family protein [Methyloprofundus sp.]